MARHLVVWLDDRIVGHVSEENDIWSFNYSDGWNEYQEHFSLSPALSVFKSTISDGSTNRSVQWFFDNLLPEEGAREVLSKEIKVNISDSFGLLEYYGSESAGAITLLPEGEKFEYSKDEILLTNEVLSKRIQNLSRQSLNFDAPKKMSLAGAQNKLAVNYHEKSGEIYEPSKRGISTHILKPDHTNYETYYNSTVNEWFIMRLAKKVGLNVPNVFLVFVPEPAYVIERFDRERNMLNMTVGRKHTIDGCQLLNLSRSNKYSNANIESLNSLINTCRSKALTRASIFNWMVFNIFIGNDDAHLKNLSFFIGEEGIELTPFYDLLSTAIYSGKEPLQCKMVYSLSNVEIFDKIHKEAIYEFAENIGINRKAAEIYLLEITKNIHSEFDNLYQEFECMELPEGYGPYKGSSLRMLREIKHNVLNEMTKKLK